MKVKDILKLSCEFLDMDMLSEKLNSDIALTDDETSEIACLEKCFNLVREEIATEISPIVRVERVKTDNLKVDFSSLSEMPVSIVAVKDKKGRNVRFRVMDCYLIAFANEIEIWYSVKPETLSLDDEFVSTFPERVFAYGVAREYYIKKALYKDAEIWEERFKCSIETLERRKSSVTIPRRGWL